MGNVVKFENSPVAIRRRLNELQRVLNSRNVYIDSLLEDIHEASIQGAATQTLYDDLLKEYIAKHGIDNVTLGDLEYSSNLAIDSNGEICFGTNDEFLVDE